MDGADHHVELRQDFVGVVQRTVLQDIHFGARQNVNSQVPVVGGVDLFDMRRHALLVQAVGDRDCFRMVGDSDVLVAKLAGRFRHLFNRVLAVAGRAVHLQVALHVLQGNQLRQLMVFGGRNFAGILSQLGRDEIQLQFRINLFFGPPSDALFTLEGCERVFVERKPHVVGAAAQCHVVLF